MTTSTSADGSDSPASSSKPPDEPSSAVAGSDPCTEVYPATVTCPHCEGEPLDGHEVGVYCLACNGSGRVCSWCRGTLGAEFCTDCGSTAAHRTTWASLDLWTAAYDPCTWEGLARRAGEQAERFRLELSETRQVLASVRADRDQLARKVEEDAGILRQSQDRARETIAEQAREHRAEIEDLKRQLRLASQRIVDLKIERAA